MSNHAVLEFHGISWYHTYISDILKSIQKQFSDFMLIYKIYKYTYQAAGVEKNIKILNIQ